MVFRAQQRQRFVRRSWGLVLALLLIGGPAAAETIDPATRSAARALAYEGVQAYEEGNYGKALQRLERAYRALPAPSLGLWSARAMIKLGMLVEASERLLEASRLTQYGGKEEVQERARENAKAERRNLLPRIPQLKIVVDGDGLEGLEVRVGESVLPVALLGAARPTNPGEWRITVLVGERSEERSVQLDEGQERTVVFDLGAPSPVSLEEVSNNAFVVPATTDGAGDPAVEQKSWMRPTGWALVAAGGAGLVLGSVTGIMAISKYNSFSCYDRVQCTDTTQEEVDSYNRLRPVSASSLVVGGILAAAGTTLLLVSPRPAGGTGVTPYVGWASAGFLGEF